MGGRSVKEYPEPDYFVDLHHGRFPTIVDKFLPGTYEIIVNQIVDVVVLPYLPVGDWPDELPCDADDIQSRDDAAMFAAAGSSIVIAPAVEGVEKVQAIRRRDVDGAVNIIFWLARTEYDQLVRDIAARLEQPIGQNGGPSTRLSQLENTAIAVFLTKRLPSAALDEYDRKILCLPVP